MSTAFRAHGKTRLEIDGDILRLYVHGPWNQELVTETHLTMQPVLAQLHGPWALMVVVLGSALCPSEALTAIRAAAARERQESGRTTTAWVFPPDIEGGVIMKGIIRNLYTGIHCVEIFSTEQEAEQWLRQSLSPDSARNLDHG